jgi:hypothetical protein
MELPDGIHACMYACMHYQCLQNCQHVYASNLCVFCCGTLLCISSTACMHVCVHNWYLYAMHLRAHRSTTINMRQGRAIESSVRANVSNTCALHDTIGRSYHHSRLVRLCLCLLLLLLLPRATLIELIEASPPFHSIPLILPSSDLTLSLHKRMNARGQQCPD